jgi:peptide methionine sulfoxide reductase MsrA
VYKEVRGVTDVESGYSNGETERPSYEQVCTGRTGHNEVVKLTYDPPRSARASCWRSSSWCTTRRR